MLFQRECAHSVEHPAKLAFVPLSPSRANYTCLIWRSLYGICSKGQYSPAYVKRKEGSVEFLEMKQYPLGVLINLKMSVQKLQFNPGDTLLFYTDGVIEARNPQGNVFTFDRLTKIASETALPGAKKIIDTVLGELRSHVRGDVHEDDVTLMALHRY